MAKRNLDYIRWQNRAFWFYVAARACFHKGFAAPAAFLSQQCVEQLVKATLIWHTPSFVPENYRHNLTRMAQEIRHRIPGQRGFTIPAYLCDGKYQSLSRYPDSSGRGYAVPGTLLIDVDQLFADLVEMVPFQRNSELSRTLKRANHSNWSAELEPNNQQLARLRKACS